jgi:hypothetical protein
MKMKAIEGLRVHVFSANMKTDLGNATIETVETLNIEGWVIPNYPSRIVLDSGKVTEGCNCWWIPLGKEGDLSYEEE